MARGSSISSPGGRRIRRRRAAHAIFEEQCWRLDAPRAAASQDFSEMVRPSAPGRDRGMSQKEPRACRSPSLRHRGRVLVNRLDVVRNPAVTLGAPPHTFAGIRRRVRPSCRAAFGAAAATRCTLMFAAPHARPGRGPTEARHEEDHLACVHNAAARRWRRDVNRLADRRRSRGSAGTGRPIGHPRSRDHGESASTVVGRQRPSRRSSRPCELLVPGLRDEARWLPGLDETTGRRRSETHVERVARSATSSTARRAPARRRGLVAPRRSWG